MDSRDCQQDTLTKLPCANSFYLANIFNANAAFRQPGLGTVTSLLIKRGTFPECDNTTPCNRLETQYSSPRYDLDVVCARV